MGIIIAACIRQQYHTTFVHLSGILPYTRGYSPPFPHIQYDGYGRGDRAPTDGGTQQ